MGKERIFLIGKETSVEKVKGVAAALQDAVYLRFKKDTPKDTMIAAAQALKNRVKFYFDINFPADTILAVAPIVVLSGGDFFFNGAMPEAIRLAVIIKLKELLKQETQQLAGKKRVSFFDGSDALTIIERNVIDALLSLSRDDSSLSLTTPGNTP